jgi:hypothetical protein
MALVSSKSFEVENGLRIIDPDNTEGPIYTGGPASPVGLDFPIGSFYVQNDSSIGTVLWSKFGSGVNDWVKKLQNDFYQISEDATETSTTSTTTYSTKCTLTTPSLPYGDYKIEYSYKFKTANANREGDVRVQRNSADVAAWVSSILRTQTYDRHGGFLIVTGISGVQTVTLQFKVNGSGTTVYMSQAVLKFSRLN